MRQCDTEKIDKRNNMQDRQQKHKLIAKLTLVGPQQRQKCTSRVESGDTQIGVLSGKKIANLQTI